MLQMLQRMPAGMAGRRGGFYSMRVHRVVCAPHNRYRSVTVIVVVVAIMITVAIIVVVAGVVVHHHTPALVHGHDTTPKGQGADHDTESDKNGGNESTHWIFPGSLSCGRNSR
jgi:hypothetical protein